MRRKGFHLADFCCGLKDTVTGRDKRQMNNLVKGNTKVSVKMRARVRGRWGSGSCDASRKVSSLEQMWDCMDNLHIPRPASGQLWVYCNEQKEETDELAGDWD